MEKMEVTHIITKDKKKLYRGPSMWVLFGSIGLALLVGFAWFMPMPGLYGGDEFISDMFMFGAFFFIGLAVLGYLEDK